MKDSDKSKEQLVKKLQQLRIELDQTRLQATNSEFVLQEKQIQLDAILDFTPALISIKDADGKVIMVSRSFSALKGPAPEDYIGKNVYELFEFDVADILWQNDKKAIQSNKPIEAEEIVQHKDDSWHAYYTYKFPLFSKSGELFGVCAISTDITQRKKLEEQLRHSQKMESLGVLASGIAHDFNNILGTILGNAEMLKVSWADDIRRAGYLASITATGQRAANLVKQILTFSRISVTDFKPINLAINVKEALEMARSIIPSSIEINHDLQQDCQVIMADPTQIDQIVLNLCNNAYHSMAESGGVLQVVLRQPDDNNVVLTIKDNGSGIRQVDLDKIFDPFFTTKEVGKGTGLGLSVVHGIVENHRGKIVVDSEEGKGTTMSVYFPVIDQSVTKVEVQPALSKPHQILRHVLVVEDEPDLNWIYSNYLEQMGFTVSSCANGAQALTLFKENPMQFDVVFTDQTMPLMTGKQLAVALLAIEPNLPIILATGFSEIIDEAEALEIGIHTYLMKPVNLSSLKGIIAQCCEKH